jgi:hypothetical protein
VTEVIKYIFDEDLSKPTVKGLLRALVPIVDKKTRNLEIESKKYLEKKN